MKHSKASIFLMELIIAILFFSMAGAVCIQMFVKANQLRQQTTNTNESIVHLQAIAECYVAQNGDLEKVADLIKNSWFYDDNTMVVCYDKEWREIDSPSEAVYASILVSKQREGVDAHINSQSALTEATACTVKIPSDEVDLSLIITQVQDEDVDGRKELIILSTPLYKHVPLTIDSHE